MKILHTADWHLGAQLKKERRYEEHDKMLKHLADLIREEKIDVVLIAGDVYDVFAPPYRAQQQYNDFLTAAGNAGAKQIIVTAGNHDSPSIFEVNSDLMSRLQIHQFGTLHENLADHIIPLTEPDGSVPAVVLAVPYLHENDIKQAVSGESYSDVQRGVYEGVVKTYTELTEMAKKQYPQAKIIAMGHFWALPGTVFNPEDLDLRDQMPIGEYTDKFDYFALGHIHTAGNIGQHKNARFSGALLPMNFGEAEELKSVTILDTDTENIADVKVVDLPVFQRIKQVCEKSVTELIGQLNALKDAGESVWVAARNTGPIDLTISRQLHDLFDNSCVKILVTENMPDKEYLTEEDQEPMPELEDITPDKIFEKMLKSQAITEEKAKELTQLFNTVYQAVKQEQRGENAE